MMNENKESPDTGTMNLHPNIAHALQTCIQETAPTQTTMYSVLQHFQENPTHSSQSNLATNQMALNQQVPFLGGQISHSLHNNVLCSASNMSDVQELSEQCGGSKYDVNKELQMIISQSTSSTDTSISSPVIAAYTIQNPQIAYQPQPTAVDVQNENSRKQTENLQHVTLPEYSTVKNQHSESNISICQLEAVKSATALMQSKTMSNNVTASCKILTQVEDSAAENNEASMETSCQLQESLPSGLPELSDSPFFPDKFSKIKKRNARSSVRDGPSSPKKNKKSYATQKEIIRKMTDTICQICTQNFKFDELIKLSGNLRIEIDNAEEECFEIQENITKDLESSLDITPFDLSDSKDDMVSDVESMNKVSKINVSVQTEECVFQNLFVDSGGDNGVQTLEKKKKKYKADHKKIKDSKRSSNKEKEVPVISISKKARNTTANGDNKKTVAPIILRTTRSSVWTKLTQKVNDEESFPSTQSRKKSSSSDSKKKSKVKKKNKGSKKAVREKLPSLSEPEPEEFDQDFSSPEGDVDDDVDDQVSGTAVDEEVSPKKTSNSSSRKSKNPQKSTKSVNVHPCPLCGVSFNGADTLEHHLKAHDSTGQYFCSVCKSNLPSQEALLEHLENNHNESADEENSVKETQNGDSDQNQKSKNDGDVKDSGQQLKPNTLSLKTLQNLRKKSASLAKSRTKLRINKPNRSKISIPVKDLTCQACFKQFTTRKTLRRHLESHRGTKDFECDICGKCFQRQDYLYHHKKGLHSAEKQFKCEECNLTFNFRNSYQLHILKHTGQRPYKCTQCEKTYLRSSHLKEHIQAVHGRIKRFKCDDCGKAFPYSHSLKLHKMLHRGDKPHMCTVCGECFVHGNALKYHEESIHGDGKSFQCDICGKYYKTEHLMKTHRRRHTSDVCRFMCDICGRQFMFKSNLDAHVNTHNDEKTFVCNICAKTFRTYGTLYTHQNVHKTEKLFTCTECGKGFKTKESCKAHAKRHTGLKPFDCEICGNCFPDKGGLSKHKRTVHVKLKPYACPVCKKTSARMDNLRVHMRVHEKEGGTSLPIIKINASGEQEIIEPLERKENNGGEATKRDPVIVTKKSQKDNKPVELNIPDSGTTNAESVQNYESFNISSAASTDTNNDNLPSNSTQPNQPQIQDRRFFYQEMSLTNAPFSTVRPILPFVPNNTGSVEPRDITSVPAVGEISSIAPTPVTGVTTSDKPVDGRDFQTMRVPTDIRQTQEYRDMQRMTTTTSDALMSLVAGEFPNYNVTYSYN